MRLLVRSKSLFALTVSAFLLLLFLPALPALAANNSPTGIIVTDDKDFPPFAFLDAAGNPRGITIDIWTLWSKKTGIPVKFDLVKWDDALKAVREGRADAVGGLFLTPERKAYFDYTKEIIRIPTAIFFHNQIAGIKGLADLSGFRVGVIKGDSSEELLRTEHPEINLLIYASTDELVRAAIAGRIRVFVADEPIALFYLAKYPGGEAFRWSSKEIAINRQYSAVRKGNHQLLTTVQSGFDKISKEEINDIVTEWSGKSSRVAVPWREIGLILFVVLFIVTAVFIWNMQLRRRVLRDTRNLEERNRELELSREAIRHSEERYRELMEHANSVILRMDKEGQILFLNEFALRFFGFRKEEVIGRNVIGTIVPEQETTGRDLAAMIKDIAVNPGIYANNENENMRSNGERVWIAWTNKPVYNPDGEVSEILCIGNDITNHKRAEEALRQSEERFAKAFRSSPAPLTITETETGRFIDVNDAWIKMLGYTREEQIGQTSKEVGIWLDPGVRDHTVQKLRRQGFCKEEPVTFIAKNGGHVQALWSAEIIELGSQKVMLSMLYDETERLAVLEALQKSEARLSSVIEGTNVGTWEWNVQTGETIFNERWAEMIGYNLAELAPISIETWQNLAHPDDLKASDRQLAEVFDRKRSHYDIECRMKHRNGDWIWVHDRGKVIYWTVDGKPGLMAGTHTDITERKQAEQQIIEYNQLLHSILAASPVGIGKIRNRTVSWVNDTLCRISGYSKQEMEGRDASIFYESPEEYERIGNLIYEEGQVETRLAAKDGSTRDVLIQIAPTDSYSYIFSIVDITQQKMDEEDLKFFKYVLDTARDSLFMVSIDARLLYVNESACNSLGYTKDELLKMYVWDNEPVYPKEKWADFLTEIRQAGSLIFESVHKKKNGTSFPVEISANLHRYHGEEYIFAFIRDITERKRAEEALRKAKAYAENLINSANAMVIGLNANGGVQVFNEAAERITGYCRAELEGKNWFEITVPKERYPQVWKEFWRLMAGGIPGEFENPILTKNGEERIISWRNSELREENQVIGSISFGIDITERRQADEALRASERLLNDIIEFLPDATLVIDPDGKVIAWNRAIETMTGIEKADMLGKGDYEYALPFYGTRRPILIDLALRRDREMENSYTAMKRYDDVLFGEALTPNLPPGDIHLSATASVLRDTKGEVIAAIECIRDNTERYRLENQLRQAQKMEAIGTLAGGIAHDFNNILGSIMGYSELAKMNASDEELERHLDQVLKASDRAKALVAQILTFSRQSSQEKKPLSVTPIFKEVLKLLRSSLPSNIQIRQKFSCPNDTVHADPTQIYQVLMNLCTNAAHAMREEGGILEVTLEPEHIPNPHIHYEYNLKQGNYTKLTVRDSGYGMEASTIEHIFEPFFTTKKEGEGTGLGLSVVYGIVRGCGGTIHVASQPDKGTTFTILLPLIEEETVHHEEAASLIPRGTGHILLVDDEEALARMGGEMLTTLGYEVSLRFSSLDALELFRKKSQEFDLVITDMTMPNMSGAMLVREMLSIRQDIPIILVTGFSERMNEQDAKGIGVREFLMKPVSLANLSQTVRKVLNPDAA